jgi:Cu/Ag efflux pump CusA
MTEIKESEVKIEESLKKIKEIQKKLGAKCDENQMSDLNINSRIRG